MTLTQEDLNNLRRTFDAKDHEFKQNFVYVKEEAVTNRIEDVDPAWSFEILKTEIRNPFCIVTARMTIKGVSRDGVGMQDLMSGNKETEAEKGAATDALKRCARLFGVGRYLTECTGMVKDNYDLLARWIANYNNGKTTPEPAQNGSEPKEWPCSEFVRELIDYWQGQELTTKDILRYAGVNAISDRAGWAKYPTRQAATIAINKAWLDEKAKTAEQPEPPAEIDTNAVRESLGNNGNRRVGGGNDGRNKKSKPALTAAPQEEPTATSDPLAKSSDW